MTLSSDFILRWLFVTAVFTVAAYLIAWMLSGLVSAVTDGWQGGGKPDGNWLKVYALCLPAGLVALVIGRQAGWWILVGLLAGTLTLYLQQFVVKFVSSRRR